MNRAATLSASEAATAAMRVGGADIPVLGFGTYGMSGPKLRDVLAAALHQGFRQIDTAQMYQNETDVGDALRVSGIPRSNVFITTKVWVGNYAGSRFMASVDESLKNLKTDYIDLLLVHWPRGGASIAEQIIGLNRSVEMGKARHIGVSNYDASLMRVAATMSRYPLVTNQVEYHPFLDQTALLKQAEDSNSSLTAYCGMAVGRVFQTPLLKDIAARYNRTVAQIVLRWLVQQPRVVALSRTENVERIAGNLKIFNFVLSDEDMAAISALKSADSRIVNPSHLAPAWD